MKSYTAYYTIENIVHVCFEAENGAEAERIAEEMADDGTAFENLSLERLSNLTLILDEVVEE